MKFTYEPTPDQLEGWQHATDKNNANAKREHDGQQLAKPEAEREEFIPFTVEEYFLWLMDNCSTSYVELMIDDHAKPVVEKFKAADKAERAELAAAVEAVEVKNDPTKPKSEK